MRCDLTFNNALDADHGKIVVATTSQAGDVPTSGNYMVYIGITDPLGNVLANIATNAGSLPAVSTLTVKYDLVWADNLFIPGTYSITVDVKDGGVTYVTRSITYVYNPQVVKSVAGLDESSNVIAMQTAPNCLNQQLCLTDETDQAGWTVSSRLLGVLAPATLTVPNPTEVTQTGVATYCFAATSGDGSYRWRMQTLRSKTTTLAGSFAFSVVLTENLQAIGYVQLYCNAICSLATSLDATYTSVENQECPGDWSALPPQQMGKILKKLTIGLTLLAAETCGDGALVAKYAALIEGTSTDCGCGCND